MDLYCKEENFELYQGDMRDIPEVLGKNSVDAIVTDPPYELNFMNKSWDNTGITFQKETWEKCFDVLKPGGYLLAFGGSRTFHRIACAIEDAGFEIRDTVMWLYGSGFPKSMNIGKSVESKLVNGSANTQEFKKLKGTKAVADSLGSTKMQHEHGARPNDYSIDGHLRTVDVDYQTEDGKKWDGWGTALKPAYEPVIVARKPCDGTCVDNVLKYGVGGINIEECRIGTEQISYKGMSAHKPEGAGCFRDDNWEPKDIDVTVNGRFPSNVILTYDETDYDEVCGGFPDTVSSGGSGESSLISGLGKNIYNSGWSHNLIPDHLGGLGDRGSAARYFYCAKASKRDRDDGLYFFEDGIGGGMSGTRDQSLKTGSGNERNNLRKNVHPTVKPVTLMQYLIRLVTPPGGVVLDPFNGSGSTGKAAMWENKERGVGYFYIGVDLNEKYLEISKARIEYAIDADKIEEEIYEKTRSEIRPGEVLDMFGSD